MLWDKCSGEVLVQGNILEDEARGLVGSVERALNFTELKKADQGRTNIYSIPLSPKSIGNVIRIKEPNEGDRNSAVIVQVQNVDQTLKQQMAMEVLASIVEQPFYSDLRTNQQLGYIVSSGVKLQNDVRSLVLTVQSDFADAVYLTDKIFVFLKDFASVLDQMSEKEIKGYIGGLADIKRQKITRLSDETSRNWDEIVEGKYQYDRALVEAKVVEELNKETLRSVWQDVVAEGGARRRVLTCQVFTQADAKSMNQFSSPLPAGATLLPDADTFRRTAQVIVPLQGNSPALAPS